MTDNATGGPAFPLTRESSFSKNYEGMTLRDWFAGQAIGAIIRQSADLRFQKDTTPAEYFSKKAYEIADAMIRERAV